MLRCEEVGDAHPTLLPWRSWPIYQVRNRFAAILNRLRRYGVRTRLMGEAGRATFNAMLALSIRQPFAELILRGIKTIEYRSRPTKIIGERFYIYACKSSEGRVQSSEGIRIWSRELAVDPAPDWMIELAEQMKMIEPGALLPRGVIVGSAIIERCLPVSSCSLPAFYEWRLTNVKRLSVPRKPTGRPQPVWFQPFV
jgi:hypothetical protein